MCGLVGYISFKNLFGPFKTSLSGYIQQGIYVGGVRGRDSTGMFTLERGSTDTYVVKNAVDGGVFIDQYNVSTALNDLSNISTVIAHHRKATKGAVTSRNAHPFKVGPITLVHNGSLFNHRTLASGNNLTVDSEAIAHAFNTHTKVEVLEQLDGAFALIWHDSRDNTINIARNDERPLAMGLVEKEETLLIASEKEMIRWLASRNNITVTNMLEPVADNLFSWDMSNKDVGAKGHTTVAFDSKKNTWAGNYNRHKNTTTPPPPKTPPLNDQLAKYSLEVGDTIEFTGTEYFPYPTRLTHGVLHGLDICGGFEVISFDVSQGDYAGALCTASITGIKETKGYPNWITVVVKGVSITDRNFCKSSNSVVHERGEKARKERATKFKKKHEDKKTGENQGPKYPVCAYNCEEKCPTCIAIEGQQKGMVKIPSQSAYSTSASGEPSSTSGEKATDGSASQFVMGPRGILITKKEWSEYTKHGCALCSCDLVDPDDVGWTNQGEPLCDDCDEMYNEDGYGLSYRYIQ